MKPNNDVAIKVKIMVLMENCSIFNIYFYFPLNEGINIMVFFFKFIFFCENAKTCWWRVLNCAKYKLPCFYISIMKLPVFLREDIKLQKIGQINVKWIKIEFF